MSISSSQLPRGLSLALVLVVGVAPLPLRAQYTVTVLGSGGINNSISYGAGGSQQVGIDGGKATLWTGSSGSAVNLNPTNSSSVTASSSAAYATNGTQQGGSANFTNANGNDHAILWSGTAAGYVDLHPAGAGYSVVQALYSTQQGGYATFSGIQHALLWSGSASAYTDLTPSATGNSGITALTGSQQGGYIGVGGHSHAALWSGTVGSLVDLNPSGATDSTVRAMYGTQQAGEAYFTTNPHAVLWSGTAGSYVDLNPLSANGSAIYAMVGGYQAGTWLDASGYTHAALWQGSSASFIDLQSYVTAAVGTAYISSRLFGVALNGTTLTLTGEAWDPVGNTTQAILITTAVPEPATTGLVLGLLGLGGVLLRRHRRKLSHD